MSDRTKATRKCGAKTDAQRKREQREREKAGIKKTLDFRCTVHVDDLTALEAFVKDLNSKRDICALW